MIKRKETTMTDIINFPSSETLTIDEKLEVWDLVIRTEGWDPELARMFCFFCSKEEDLTREQLAKYPAVLAFWREIEASIERWQAQRSYH
ncbi:hypothetical protein SAMN05443247_06528 [Bradyrhizobium erythrophlei]|nr:hypothetical protein SAMN05443247_06528 [Bradyrhizobium erythrophlei]